jgi:hypothetical protein
MFDFHIDYGLENSGRREKSTDGLIVSRETV